MAIVRVIDLRTNRLILNTKLESYSKAASLFEKFNTPFYNTQLIAG